MASAIVFGGLDAGVLAPDRVAVCDPDGAKRSAFEARGVRTCQPGAEIVRWLADAGGARHLLLAVKPQMLADVAGQIRDPLAAIDDARGRAVVVSILAGVTTRGLAAALGEGPAHIRLMPNTPAQVGRGLTAIAPAPGVREEETRFTRTLFGALGEVIELDETMIDAFTAVAGSGPAYLFYLTEAISRGAERVGFDEATARRLAEGTIVGAATLLARAGEPAGALRARVTSKNGTTEAAITRLDEAGVMEAFGDAIEAARDRGRELGFAG